MVPTKYESKYCHPTILMIKKSQNESANRFSSSKMDEMTVDPVNKIHKVSESISTRGLPMFWTSGIPSFFHMAIDTQGFQPIGLKPWCNADPQISFHRSTFLFTPVLLNDDRQ